MSRGHVLNFAFASEYLNAAGLVSLLSVLVLVGLFWYLNRYTGRRYFNLWTLGWVSYACWLWLGLRSNTVLPNPMTLMVKQWCIGVSAVLMFWGSAKFLKLPARPMVFYLFIGFILVWSYVGAYHLKEPLQMRLPIFGTIGLASLITGFSFYRLRKYREFIGAGLLCFGFTLWGVYLMVSPMLANEQSAGTGFLISAVLQLVIAVSMIILVLEEARAATDLVLSRLRAYEFGAPAIEGVGGRAESPYHGLFDQAALNEKLRAAYTDLRQTQERNLQQERLQALGQMSRGMAHDINNALTPIIGYANLLLSAHRDLPEEVLKYIRGIKNAGERISQSVACIREFYRKDSGTATLAQVDLNQAIQGLVEASRARWFESRHVKLSTEADPQLPRIVGQKSELREALGQIIHNSLEAMSGGGTLTIRTRLRPNGFVRPGAATADAVEVEISDTGIGMDEETRKRCLEPFFSTKNQQGAKGLGLSLVFGTMQRHGGRIAIDSESGRGTTVRLAFPAFKSAPETVAAAEEDLPSLRILCVDDEPSVLDVLRILLKAKGHEVEVAGEGVRALEVFRATRTTCAPFDVVLTDLAMPRMDGRELAKMIKRESPSTPVIMVTGWGDIMKAEETHPENIDAVLSKPPDVKELLVTLGKLFASRARAA